MMSKHNATSRFSSRVADYVRYRPGYPAAVIDTLRTQCGLDARSIVADIGSGTGILSALLLDTGCKVFGVEPNAGMRDAGDLLLAGYPRFSSINATAEDTTLPDASVDLITAAQAYHWFDPLKARAEFLRILKPGGWVVLTWNERQTDTTPFLRDYEQLLRTYGTDYTVIDHRNTDPASLGVSFALVTFPNVQLFDFDGVRGRLLSSSYVPAAGEAGHASMLADLRVLFDRHQVNGQVPMHYTTQLYFGQF